MEAIRKPLRIDILNEKGRDAPVDYRAGPGAPDAGVHPPVNYWAFAACSGGRFYQQLRDVDLGADAIIVLLRQRNGATLEAVDALKRLGRRVYISWKETGLHQLAQQTRWPWQRNTLKKIHALADGAVAVTLGAIEHYRRFGGEDYPVHFIPTPYPVDVPGWDFSAPVGERQGIFIGTRQFDVPSRRHAETLALAAAAARKLGCRVTVLNTDGAGARRKIQRLLAGAQLNLVERRLSYPDYLRLMAGHRLVLQRDASNVPGQVAGDALLCRIVNVGGDGTVQRAVFPEYSRINDDEAALAAVLEKLLTDDTAYAEAVDLSLQRAMQVLSYRAGREKLNVLLGIDEATVRIARQPLPP